MKWFRSGCKYCVFVDAKIQYRVQKTYNKAIVVVCIVWHPVCDKHWRQNEVRLVVAEKRGKVRQSLPGAGHEQQRLWKGWGPILRLDKDIEKKLSVRL